MSEHVGLETGYGPHFQVIRLSRCLQPSRPEHYVGNPSTTRRACSITPLVKTPPSSNEIARRWMIAATAGAMSDWHMDASGYGTRVDQWLGWKLRVVRIKPSTGDHQKLLSELG